MKIFEALLLDLDGTLVDTAPDMLAALNQLCAKNGLVTFPSGELRNYISQGALTLIKKAIPDKNEAELEKLRQEYLTIYHAQVAERSSVFVGGFDLITQLESKMPWGVVTNKPTWLTEPLLESLNIQPPILVCGDTLSLRKPNPEPLCFACEQLGVDPTSTIYVGDAKNDVVAGNAAGLYTVIASYGYIHETERPETWGANHTINQLSELINLID